MSATSRALVAGTVALAATAAIAVIPFLRFAYVSASSRVAMDVAQAMIAGLVGYLVFGRFQRSRSWSDLVVVYALGMSGATNLLTVVVRAGTEDRTELSPFTAWTAQALAVVAAGAFVFAAFASGRTVSRSFAAGRCLMASVIATVVGASLLIAPIANALPFDATRIVDVGASGRPDLETHPVLLAMHAVLMGLLVLAAVGFVRRPEVDDADPIALAIAPGLVLAAVARLNFVLYPSLFTNVVHTGDVLRLGFYLVLLVGAEREIRIYWEDRARAAVLDERRRIARELHDGLMQELSFIRSHTRSVAANRSDPAMLDFVATASERALDESRRAVRALSDSGDEALDVAVRRAVDEVTARAGLCVVFDLAPGLQLDAGATANVARIAREAAVNAVHHAAANELNVFLQQRSTDIRLSVTDDGRGMPDRIAGGGYGLGTMHDRAEELCGRLSIGRGGDGGTTVCLDFPGESARPVPLEKIEERPDAC